MKRLLLALFLVASLILPMQGNAGLTVFGGFLPCTSDNGTLCTTSRYISTPGITFTTSATFSFLTSGYLPKAGTSGALGNSLLYQSSYAGFWNDTANTKNTYGFTINQLAADDEILSLKSSDVAHGMTGNTETDTYFYIKKASATLGGNSIAGLSAGDASGFKFWGVIGSNAPTATTPSMSFHSLKKDAGGTDVTTLGATETAFSFQNSTTPLVTILGSGETQLAYGKITAGSGTGITVNSAGHLNRQTYKVTTTYAAYADTDTKKGIVIATLPAKMKIVGCYADTTAAYTGGTVSAATLVVGKAAEDAGEILASHDVHSGAVTKGLADADMGTSMTRAAQIQGGYLPSWTGTTAIYATINTTDGNTNALTAGSTTFYIVTEQF